MVEEEEGMERVGVEYRGEGEAKTDGRRKMRGRGGRRKPGEGKNGIDKKRSAKKYSCR